MSYDPTKYVVQRVTGVAGDEAIEVLDPKEFFVLKKGDLLAHAALWSYLHNLQLILEFDDTREGPTIDAHTREHLEDLRDSVSMLVEHWTVDTVPKLPD